MVTDQDGGEGYKHTHKKNEAKIQLSWPKKLGSIKEIYMASASASGNFFLRDTARNPERSR